MHYNDDDDYGERSTKSAIPSRHSICALCTRMKNCCMRVNRRRCFKAVESQMRISLRASGRIQFIHALWLFTCTCTNPEIRPLTAFIKLPRKFPHNAKSLELPLFSTTRHCSTGFVPRILFAR